MRTDRKSTRLNSSHVAISYAVFCLKKKKKHKPRLRLKKIKKNSRALEAIIVHIASPFFFIAYTFFVYVNGPRLLCFFFFFFNDTATTEIYTLSLHDALPISCATDVPSSPCSSRCSSPCR